jgi:zinc D-Ala-D-Ala dipeptidase
MKRTLALLMIVTTAALAQTPAGSPIRGPFRASDLVELTKVDSTIKLDIRYATTHNFKDFQDYAVQDIPFSAIR